MTLHVLAIDDSRTIRSLLRHAMEAAGFACTTAEDGEAGVECFGSLDPDVVITDLNMPRLDGFGVIERIRKGAHRRQVPIVVLTTESAAELKSRAKAAGASGWIVKPFEDAALVTLVRRLAGIGGAQ